MKSTKKALSIILALILAFGSFGVISASASSQNAAAEAAKAYNAAPKDFSYLYDNISQSKAEKLYSTANSVVAKLLEGTDIAKLVYTDNVATVIAKKLGELLKNNIVNSLDENYLKSAYPEVYTYFMDTCKGDWSNVDPAKTPWGITPGDKEAFQNAVAASTDNFGDTIVFVAAIGSFYGVENVYSNELSDLLESLHIGKCQDWDTLFKAASDSKKAGNYVMKYIASRLCDAVDLFAADPVNYICDVLPDFVSTYEKVSVSLSASLAKVGTSMTLPDFNGIVAAIGEGLNLTMPKIDTAKLISMGDASAVESNLPGGFRMQINGKKNVVFMAVLNYAQTLLENEDNQVALGRLIIEKTGYADTQTYDKMIECAEKGDNLGFAENALTLVEQVVNTVTQSSTASFFAKLLARVTGFFAEIVKVFLRFFSAIGISVSIK